MPLVSAKNLGLTLESGPVLSPLSFEIGKGEFVSFIGPSGCGKTTLLCIMGGMRKGYSGEINVQTEKLSFVFQNSTLLDWQSVLGNILLPFALKNQAISPAIRSRAAELLRMVGLDGCGNYFPHQLSGGMCKRVEIARALITEPELLILDEPFSSLDIITRERLNLLLKKLHAPRTTTIVLVTHSVEEACFLSEKIFVLSARPAEIIDTITTDTIATDTIASDTITATTIAPDTLTTAAIPAAGSAAEDGNENRSRTAHSSEEGVSPLYILSEKQRELNTSIRSRVKHLWEPESGGAAPGEKTSPGGESPDTTLGATAGGGRFAAIRGFIRRKWHALLFPLEAAALYFLLGFVKKIFRVSDLIFPEPAAVLRNFWETLASGEIFPDLEMTVSESLGGFLIALVLSLAAGFFIARFKNVSRLLMPWLIGINTIPTVALAPFLVLWLGFGFLPRLAAAILLIFFPLLISVITAFASSAAKFHSLILFYRPSKIRSLLFMEFPAALPGIFSGIKISITLSVIGAVVGEFVSGSEGLGALVNRAKANFEIELMFTGLLWLILLGLAYYVLASACYYLIRRRLQTPRGH
jgi:NitT/TauT family transport system ATP-binding protein